MENLEKNEILNNFVLNNIKEISKKNNINLQTKIIDLNLDFIDFIELCLEIEEEYNIFLDEELIEKKEKIIDLIEYIKESLN